MEETRASGEANGLAIAALVLGILGVTALPLVGSVLALVLGYRTRREILRSGQQGEGMATAGIVLGWVGVGLAVFFLVLGLLFVVAFLPWRMMGL